jgi:hypothetical protein
MEYLFCWQDMATKYLNHELNFLGTENNETEEVYCVKKFQPLIFHSVLQGFTVINILLDGLVNISTWETKIHKKYISLFVTEGTGISGQMKNLIIYIEIEI